MTHNPGTGAVALLSELVHCIHYHGPEKTAAILYNSRAAELKLDDENVKAVLSIVSQVVRIPVSEILSGEGRKNDRTFAIGLCAWYLKFEFKYTPKKIAFSLNRDRTQCWRNTKLILKLNPKKKVDQNYCELKDKCDKEIAAYIESKNVFH